MARLIVKSPYIKCGAGQSAGGYLKYIATRERVEIIPDDRPPTNKQTQLIAKLVKDFPDAKELMEYEDYTARPTKATASALITLALESNWDRVQGMGNIFRDNAPAPAANGIQIDRKRLAQMRQKRVALGHKPDDHELEQQQGFSMKFHM